MMMNLKLSKKNKLIISIGVALLLVALVYRLSPLIQDVGGEADEISLKSQKMVKYMQRIQDAPTLEQRRRALDRNFQRLEQRLLQAKTPALAAVSMQNLVNGIARSMGVEIKRQNVLKVDGIESTGYISVPVQFSFNATVQQVKRLLYEIESSNTFLRVTVLKLRSTTDALPVQLQATVTIEGMMYETAPSS
jgi:Tfp pilus assembly protein PilN